MGFLTSAVSNELLGNTYCPPHPKWPILQCTPCPDSTDVDNSASTMSIPGPSPSSRAHTLVAARLLKASNNAVNISRGDITLLLIPMRRDWRHRFTHVRWRHQELSSSRFSALSLIIIARLWKCGLVRFGRPNSAQPTTAPVQRIYQFLCTAHRHRCDWAKINRFTPVESPTSAHRLCTGVHQPRQPNMYWNIINCLTIVTGP